MIVHDVVLVVTHGGPCSHRTGRTFLESYDDKAKAQAKADTYNYFRNGCVTDFVSYVVETHEESSPERANP